MTQPGFSVRHHVAIFGLLLTCAFFVRLLPALLFPNLHRPDEIFENLEPAFRIWFGHGVVTWEWRDGIRSPIFPGFLASLIGLATKLGLGVEGYLATIAATLSALSTTAVGIAMLMGWRHSRTAGAILCGVICATWPDLMYFGPKPLAEIQAAHLLLIAVYLAGYPLGSDASTWEYRRGVKARIFIVGVLLGLTLCVRFQLAPAVLLTAFWCGRLQFRRRWLFLLCGGALPVLAMGIVDDFFWGSLFHSVRLNIELNLVQKVSEEFGIKPIYWYAGKLLDEWGGAIVPLAVAFVAGARIAPLFASVAALVLLSHSVIAHKEISFVYAALPPLIVVVGLGAAEIVRVLTQFRPPAARGVAMAGASVFWIATGLTTAVGGGFRPWWTAQNALLSAQAEMRRDPTLCGVGLRWPEVAWYWTGGNVYLGRAVPIYAFRTEAGTARVLPAINYAIGGRNVAHGLAGFRVMKCWSGEGGDICLARAEPSRTCTPDPGFDLNSVPNLGRQGTYSGADK